MMSWSRLFKQCSNLSCIRTDVLRYPSGLTAADFGVVEMAVNNASGAPGGIILEGYKTQALGNLNWTTMVTLTAQISTP